MPRRKSTHVDDPHAVGRRLREARERAGISQRQLSFDGCSPAYISRIEAGERIPSLQLLREMGRRLGVSEDYLATGLEREAGGEDRMLVDAEVSLRLGEIDDAERAYREILDKAETTALRSRALAGMGQIAFERGNAQKAIELLEEALRLSEAEAADQPAVADTLGRAYSTLGDHQPAIRIFRQALRAAEERRDAVEVVRFGVLLANAYIDSNALVDAEALLEKTVDEAPNAADPIFRARIFWSQSRLYAMREDPATAARYARKALELLELTEHTHYAARAHHLLAHVELDRGNAEEALALLDKGLPLVEATGNILETALFRLEKARALAELGRTDEATAHAEESTAMLEAGAPLDAGRGYTLVGEIYERLGDWERARAFYEKAVELLEGGADRYLVEAYGKLAALLEAEGRPDEALAVLKKAMSVQSPGAAVSAA
ncbi:MAG TPA: tetratricopeptide repeat protein [Gaiellaceae bacterium]|nr:tetratricopeptide repeat protein [Gaiellaceae bacterium]